MRNAFNKEIVRSIRQSAGRFAAIAVISLLGAGFFAGLRMAAPDMRLAGDEFFDGTNLYDISLISTLGFDDASLQALGAVEGVEDMMAVHQADEMAVANGRSFAVRIESLPMTAARESDTSDGASARFEGAGYLNRPVLVEGSWPDAPGECVVGARAAEELSLSLGDEIVLEGEAEALADTFAITTFTVSGLVNAPAFSASGLLGITSVGTGELELYAYVDAEAFSGELPYSVVYVTCAGAAGASWAGDEYDRVVGEVVRRIEERAGAIGEARRAAIVEEAEDELAEARADYERERADAERELADARAELGDARRSLDDAQAALASAKAGLDAAASELPTSRARLESGEGEYAAGASRLEAEREQLAPGLAQLDALKAALENPDLPADQRAAIEAQIAQIESGAQALAAAERELAASRAQLDAGWREWEAGRARYEQGLAEYERGEAEYRQGVASYESGLAEWEAGKAEAQEGFADAERELADAQADIDGIEQAEVYVMDRSKNAGAASLASDAEGIAQIATFLPFMFFLVAALVSLTSMTRMVDEGRLEIGTHKALGYGVGRITSKYLVYGVLAAGAGSIVGVFALGKLLPWFILTSYQVSYTLPTTPLPIDASVAAWAIGLSVGVTAIATLASAGASLRESPASLMLPRAPKAGKRIILERIGPVWSRLSFSQKVTARNLLRYKKRFFMATVGIAGCTALLMVGFGLRDAIGGIVSNQYEQLIRYDAVVRADDDATDDQRRDIARVIESDAELFVEVDEFNMVAEGDGEELRVQVVVPADARKLAELVSLRERESGKPIELDGKGLVLSEKAAGVIGAVPGGGVWLRDENLVGDPTGPARAFDVAGVAENYLGHYAYLSAEGYREAFGERPAFDAWYVKLAPDSDRAAFSSTLLSTEGVSTVSFVADAVATYEEMLAIMDSLILVIVALSAALAFVVLYNLTNINIGERIREIATLKVLGFTRREVNVYIFREIVVMALIGALVGCVLGVPLTFYIAEAAETANMMFGRVIEPASFVLSFAITMAFSVIVALTMRGKLARVDMVESLKSIE